MAQSDPPERCTPSTVACLTSIQEEGYGAVEICRECFPCGLSDGICPENFTDGNAEAYTDKKQMILKVGEDRPLNHANTRPFTVQYDTGDAACAVIGGTCTGIKEKESRDDTWSESEKTCSQDMNNLLNDNKFYLAECSGVPQTAGCYNCPDPDCEVTVRGYAYDNSSEGNESLNARVSVVSDNNWRLKYETNATNGRYNLSAARGNMEVICTYKDYVASRTSLYLQPGVNIVDCPLEEAYCSPSCTMPNDEGVEVCRARCDGQNGCEYETGTNPVDGSIVNASEVCEDVPDGSRVILERIDETHLWGVECCTGSFNTYESKPFNIEDNKQIKNLLTKTIKKTLNGEPVEVKIIVYDKVVE